MMRPGGDWQAAASDLYAGLSRAWLWGGLAWSDIKLRYRGSILGSFWITINLALLIGCLTLIFAGPFGSDREAYAAYVAIALVLWYFIQGTLNDSCQVFIASADTIRHSSTPLSIHVLRLVWRNAIVLGHNVVIIPIVLVAFAVNPSPAVWTVVPGFLLLIFTLFWGSLLLGLLGARFRDITQLVSNLLQLLFFLTPIFWPVGTLGDSRGWILALNPIYPFIDIIRAPLLGVAASPGSWPVAIVLALVSAVAAFLALSHLRRHVAYWL